MSVLCWPIVAPLKLIYLERVHNDHIIGIRITDDKKWIAKETEATLLGYILSHAQPHNDRVRYRVVTAIGLLT